MRVKVWQFKSGNQGRKLDRGTHDLFIVKAELKYQRVVGCTTEVMSKPQRLRMVEIDNRLFEVRDGEITLPSNIGVFKTPPKDSTKDDTPPRLFVVRLALAHGPQPEVLAQGVEKVDAITEAMNWWNATYPRTTIDAATVVNGSKGMLYATPGASASAKDKDAPTDHVRLARIENALAYLAGAINMAPLTDILDGKRLN